MRATTGPLALRSMLLSDKLKMELTDANKNYVILTSPDLF